MEEHFDNLHFERCLIEDRDGWKLVSSTEKYADEYIQIEQAEYLTPTQQDTPIPWTIAHRRSPHRPHNRSAPEDTDRLWGL